MEAYSVWATLNLKGDAQKKLEQLSKLTQNLNDSFKKLDNSAYNFSKKMMLLSDISEKSSSNIKKLVSNFKNLNVESKSGLDKFSGLNRALTLAGDRMDTIARKTQKLSSDLSKLGHSAAVASENIGGIRGSVGTVRSPRASSGGGMMGNLGMLSLGMVGGPIGELATGYMVAGPAGAAVSGFMNIGQAGFQQGAEFQNQISILKMQGLSSQNIQKAIAQANAVNIPGVSQLTMIKSIVDAQMATQNFKLAQKMAPGLAKFSVSAKSTYGDFSDNQMQNAIRFSELMGHSDLDSIMKWLVASFKMMSLSGGSLLPTGMRTFARMIAGAGSRITPQAFMEMEPVIQSLGEARTGTGLTTGINQLFSGIGLQMNKKRVERLIELGLGKASYNKYGTQMKFKLRNDFAEDLMTDPVKFVLQDLVPSIKKMGITSEAGIQKEMVADLPTTFSRVAVQIYKDRQKIANIGKNYGNLQDVNQGYNTAINTPQGKLTQISAAFNKMAFSFNKLANPAIMIGMDYLIKILGFLEKFFNSLMSLKNLDNSGTFLGNPFAFLAKKANEKIMPGVKDAKSSHSPYINSTNSTAVTVVSPIHIDGKKVGQSVSHHLFDMGNSFGTLGSPMNFNSSLFAYPTAHNYTSPF